MKGTILLASTLLAAGVLGQNLSNFIPQNSSFVNHTSTILRVDNGTQGPALEEYHYYYDQWPIGLAISSKGRFFASYTRGDYTYTVGEAVNKTAEKPYPSADLQLAPSALNTSWNGIAFGSNDSTKFVSVQALYITPASSSGDRPEILWVLDTGRPTVHDGQGKPSMPYAQPGGPKLVAISLDDDSVYATYTFPATVHYPDSYLNDLRFDLRPNASVSHTPGSNSTTTTTTSGGSPSSSSSPSNSNLTGIAYLVDSSNEGRTGFIMLDLATGESWRRLNQDASVLRVPNDVPTYFGNPFYYRPLGSPISWQQEGLDGLQLSPDGSTLYYSPLTSDTLYSIPTANLRLRDSDSPYAELWAHANVSSKGQRGGNANGFEGDDQGRIYQLMPSQNAVYWYDPAMGVTRPFLRDPRILWPDGATVGEDGYLYLNINQLPFQPDWNDGLDGRLYPGAVLRAKLPDGARKISTLWG